MTVLPVKLVLLPETTVVPVPLWVRLPLPASDAPINPLVKLKAPVLLSVPTPLTVPLPKLSADTALLKLDTFSVPPLIVRPLVPSALLVPTLTCPALIVVTPM